MAACVAFMAKTKKDCLAAQRTDLHANPPAAAAPAADAPTTRHRQKRPAEPKPVERSSKKPALETPPKEPMDPPFELSWDNLHRVKKFYNITYVEAQDLLLEVIGPDPRGNPLREAIARMAAVKQEREAAEPAAKRSKTTPAPPAPPASPAPEEFETMAPEVDPTQEDYDGQEDGEEEELDGDPLDENDDIAVSATSRGNDDDQDSPAAGATAEAEVEVMGRPEAVEGGEPTRTPVAVCEERENAKSKVPHALDRVPTPLRPTSRKVVEAKRVDTGRAASSKDTPKLKSLLSLDFHWYQCFEVCVLQSCKNMYVYICIYLYIFYEHFVCQCKTLELKKTYPQVVHYAAAGTTTSFPSGLLLGSWRFCEAIQRCRPEFRASWHMVCQQVLSPLAINKQIYFYNIYIYNLHKPYMYIVAN